MADFYCYKCKISGAVKKTSIAVLWRDRQIVGQFLRRLTTPLSEGLQLIDIGQHLGDGHEQPLGDFIVELGGVVDGPGQRR